MLTLQILSVLFQTIHFLSVFLLGLMGSRASMFISIVVLHIGRCVGVFTTSVTHYHFVKMSSMWTSMGRRKIRLNVILKDFPSLQRSCLVFNLQLDQYLVGLSGCNECVVRMGSSRLSFYRTRHNFCFFCQKCGVGDEYVSTNNPRICFA